MQGYKRKTGGVTDDGSGERGLCDERIVDMKRGLLVIDVQNEYFTEKLPVYYPPGSFDNILRAMDAARSHRVSVIVVQHTARSDASPIFQKGTHEWRLHPAVDLRPRDVLI